MVDNTLEATFDKLFDAIRQGVVKNALKVSTEHLEIVPAALKGDGGVIGAATFARGKG
ncbi:MAG: hypothetical protein WCG42_09350 [Parachlamydiaceae bacterium]